MKKSEHNSQVRRAAIAILSYFRDHSSAKDTAQGIAKFWVGENEGIVTDALTILVKEGAIEKRGQVFQLIKSGGTIANRALVEKILQRLN